MSAARDRVNQQVKLCRRRKRDGLIRILVWAREIELVDVLVDASYAPRQSGFGSQTGSRRTTALTSARGPTPDRALIESRSGKWPCWTIAIRRSASAGASSRNATRPTAPKGSPASSARAAAVISGSI
jgi:hypothetical protein